MTARKAAWLVSVAALAGAAHLWAGVATRQGDEYAITTPLTGDQINAQVSLAADGGYLVWHDNATDGAGLGIGARRLDASLNGSYGVFRVNEIGAGDQENPQVALLAGGGAVFTWQGGPLGSQKIYLRFLGPSGTFTTPDIQANSYNLGHQCDPQVAALADGNVVVVWSSFGQDGSLLGVYGQRFSPAGQKLGTEFQVAQSTLNNQRTPAVLAVPDGGFLVAWVSETFKGVTMHLDENGLPSDAASGLTLYAVQVFGRKFNAQGVPAGGELVLSAEGRLAANPNLALSPSGVVLLSYSGRSIVKPGAAPANHDRWDVYAVALGTDGSVVRPEYRVNGHVTGDQFRPKAAAFGADFLVIWTSLGQDGSREGVFSRVAGATGVVGEESIVNTRRISRQLSPAVASTTADSALVVWSTFLGGTASFDVHAQRLAAVSTLATPEPPFVSAVSQTRLSITWAPVTGLELAAYELYIDGQGVPVEVLGNRYLLEGLQPGSTHSFRLAYRLADGRKSEISASAAQRTWGEDASYDGLPDDWQATYWPGAATQWPGAKEDSDQDGATNLQELLAGTIPTDPASALKLRLVDSAQGRRLEWSTRPGSIYQVQVSTDLGVWVPLGPERFAADTVDTAPAEGSGSLEVYRIIRIR